MNLTKCASSAPNSGGTRATPEHPMRPDQLHSCATGVSVLPEAECSLAQEERD